MLVIQKDKNLIRQKGGDKDDEFFYVTRLRKNAVVRKLETFTLQREKVV